MKNGFEVRLVVGSWQGGEYVDGQWHGMTGRHRNTKPGKAAAERDLKRKVKELGAK